MTLNTPSDDWMPEIRREAHKQAQIGNYWASKCVRFMDQSHKLQERVSDLIRMVDERDEENKGLHRLLADACTERDMASSHNDELTADVRRLEKQLAEVKAHTRGVELQRDTLMRDSKLLRDALARKREDVDRLTAINDELSDKLQEERRNTAAKSSGSRRPATRFATW